MKSVLGFTTREHRGYRPRTPKEIANHSELDYYENDSQKDFHRKNIHENVICLDFYSERKYTMFLLKFSEILNKTETSIWK